MLETYARAARNRQRAAEIWKNVERLDREDRERELREMERRRERRGKKAAPRTKPAAATAAVPAVPESTAGAAEAPAAAALPAEPPVCELLDEACQLAGARAAGLTEDLVGAFSGGEAGCALCWGTVVLPQRWFQRAPAIPPSPPPCPLPPTACSLRCVGPRAEGLPFDAAVQAAAGAALPLGIPAHPHEPAAAGPGGASARRGRGGGELGGGQRHGVRVRRSGKPCAAAYGVAAGWAAQAAYCKHAVAFCK